MPRRASGKKYVQRDEIRGNPDLPLEVRFVLDCADHIRPKFLAIPTWLVAAGPLGLNLAELRALTGLGIISCENTLEALAARDLAREEPSGLPGEPSRWFPVLAYAKGKGNEGKEDSKENQSRLINPEGIYNTSSGDNLSPESPDPKIVHKPKVKRLKGSECKRKQSDSAGLPENAGILPVESLTIAEPKSLPAPMVAKRRRKKLKRKPATGAEGKKLEAKPSPRASLADDLTAETKRRYGHGGRYKTYLKNPSDNPAVLDWKQKPKPNRWGPLDWVGYWLHNWREFYGEEDPNFIDQTLHRTIAKSRERTKGGLDIYWTTGFQMERFRDSDRTFKGNGIQLKEYVDWLFGTFLPENASWMDTPISANQIFRVTNNFFLDKFKVRNVKPAKGKKKQKGKWHPWGYSYDD